MIVGIRVGSGIAPLRSQSPSRVTLVATTSASVTPARIPSIARVGTVVARRPAVVANGSDETPAARIAARTRDGILSYLWAQRKESENCSDKTRSENDDDRGHGTKDLDPETSAPDRQDSRGTTRLFGESRLDLYRGAGSMYLAGDRLKRSDCPTAMLSVFQLAPQKCFAR